MHAIYWLAASVGPAVLVVDDLHWLDASSLRALDYLARRSADLPLLLVGALRPSEPGRHVELLDGLRQQPATTTVAVRTLSDDAVTALVRTQVPDAGDDLCAAFATASAGNPLYLRELLAAGLDDPEAVAAADLPTLGERVSRRIARIDPLAPALAAAMAVLGDGTPLARAAAVAQVSEQDASRIAHRLVRLDVLASADPVAFSHPVIRHSVYAELTEAERADAARTRGRDARRPRGEGEPPGRAAARARRR